MFNATWLLLLAKDSHLYYTPIRKVATPIESNIVNRANPLRQPFRHIRLRHIAFDILEINASTSSRPAGPDRICADRILKESQLGTRQSPSRMKKAEIATLHAAMHSVNLDEGQSMNILRYANRVPLQFQHAACAITQTIMATNWRAYGLSQSRGSLPAGPVTVMVHMASVWVPFTSESKEAVASYPEIQKELRLALQAVGRKLGMYLRKRLRVKQEGDRRSIFLRYLGEVARAVSDINQADRDDLYNQLLLVAKKKTAEADVRLDERGRPVEEEALDLGKNVLIVEREPPPATT